MGYKGYFRDPGEEDILADMLMGESQCREAAHGFTEISVAN